MKKLYILTSILLLTTGVLFAQMPANRTTGTIVADILAQSPFEKPKDYNKSMEVLLSTKEEGVLQLVSMMKNPAKGDNAKIEYALSGLTHFAATKSEEDRLAISNAYVKALSSTTERETLAFVMRQLELIAEDEATNEISKFLTNPSLSGPAARVLSNIGSKAATNNLLDVLRTTTDNKIKADIVDALGFMKAETAEASVRGLLNSGDIKLQQTVVQALGKLGSKASLKDLNNLAKKANYTLDNNDSATGAYLALIEKLINDGATKDAEKAAKSLTSDAKKAGAYGTRIAALNLWFKANPAEAIKESIKALKEDCPRYRLEALRAAARVTEIGAFTKEVMASYAKANSTIKTDIAGWIEEEAKCPENRAKLLPLTSAPLIASLTTPSASELTATTKALIALESPGTIAPLADLLASDDAAITTIAKNALANTKGDITNAITNKLSSNDRAAIAALDLLALRKSSKHLGEVIKLTNTGSDDVKAAAFKTLKNVTEAKDINTLYSLLEASDAKYTADLQAAIIATLNYMPTEKRFDEIANKVAKTPDSKKYLYYTALASTEDPRALDIILTGFNSNNKTQKDAAFEALTSWNNPIVADYLMNICNDPSASAYFDRALDAYIKVGSAESLTGENRVIYLRNAMSVAKTNKQRNQILKQIQKTGTFQGLIFAGKFLDDKALQETASHAVMNIALGNKNFTGAEVEALLNKVMVTLNNPDAEYQKASIKKHLNEVSMKDGFVSIFNGKDLSGWKGLVADPIKRAKMSPSTLKKEQAKADEQMRKDWSVLDGCIVFDGKGFNNLCTEKQYGDFEMYVDWKLDPAGPEADAGVYLRGTPQVQIWDTARVDVGAQVGSGGLYNNQTNPSKPLVVADNKLGEWNTLYIKMVGDRVTVKLNGKLVVDNVILENYWDRSQPIFPIEQIELQAHGSKVYYRDIYIKELKRAEPYKLSAEEEKEGFEILFDGTNMHKWTGNTADYRLEDGVISLHPSKRFGGNLYTKEQFDNFIYRFEFMLTPGANNGVGIRTPMEGDAAYVGMEIQILDHDHPIYSKITPLQVHGSVYGIIGAKRAKLKPAGEWNYEEIIADGDNIKVTLNGEVILEGNLKEAMKNGAADGKDHPGVTNKSGHIAFLGHGNPIKFKNIRIKKLK